MSSFRRFTTGVLCALAFALFSAASLLAAPGDYGNGGGYALSPPYDPSSFTTLLAAFPASTKRIVGGYPLAGRLVAATGRTLFLLQTFGSNEWIPVAVLDPNTDPSMDPAFVAITPDGEKIALGVGLGKPLYVFPTKSLSVASPVVLTTTPGIRRDGLNYYSAAFYDNRYLFVNAGGDELGTSMIYAIDTQSSSSATIPIIDGIPGASGGIAFDAAGDLVTGIGWDPDGVRTGEVKMFDASVVAAPLTGDSSADYETDGAVVATGMLSADSLGFDASGTLYVGGGDVFGSSGRYGYAEIIAATAIANARGGGPPAAPDSSDVARIAPDPCHNDDWTGVTFVPGVDMLVVSSNLGTLPPNCDTVDWSTGPATPRSIYFPPDAPDVDHDGIPDGVDPDFEPQHLLGRDELSRLVNALDTVKSSPTFDSSVDFDGDGKIGDADFAFLQAHWGLPASP